ncbi:MAG: hypothetical protein J2P17_31375, partial [Mycobacterium sp.]|nr:hypothetical protein [Mycobacterium sp.]
QQGEQVGNASGYYKMDIDQMRGMVAKWNKIIDRIKLHESHLDNIRYVNRPGDDPVSIAHEKALRNWGQTQYSKYEKRKQYIQHNVDAMQKSIDAYEQREQQTAADLHRQAT